MKIGSRPIARIARTGEFTPPGRYCTARSKSAADFVSRTETGTRVSGPAVLAFPVLEVLGEVQEADLLELGGGVERRSLGDAELLADRVEDRVALLLGAPVGHGEDRVRPVGVGR